MKRELIEVRARLSARSGDHQIDGNPPSWHGPENLRRFRGNQA
jgi:hypothetical protein